jgi:hypothetical protein
MLINGPGNEAMAQASLVPPGLRHEGAVAIMAPMEGSEIADNPSLDATGGDAEVSGVPRTNIGIVTGEIAALAIGALDSPERDDVIGAQAIALLVLLLAPLQGLETRVGSEINFVSLIIQIRPLVDEREVLNRKSVLPKCRPVILGFDLLNKPQAAFLRLARLTVCWESSQKLPDLLQCDTVLLVVQDQAILQGGSVRLLPLGSPDQGVEPCGLRRGPCAPQLVPDCFEFVGRGREVNSGIEQ